MAGADDEEGCPLRLVRLLIMAATNPVRSRSFPFTSTCSTAARSTKDEAAMALARGATASRSKERKCECNVLDDATSIAEGEATESSSEGEEVDVGRSSPETRRTERPLLMLSAIAADVEAECAIGGNLVDADDDREAGGREGGEGSPTSAAGGENDSLAVDAKEVGEEEIVCV